MNKTKGRKRFLTHEKPIHSTERSPFTKCARVRIPSSAKTICFRPGTVITAFPSVLSKFHTPKRVFITTFKENPKSASTKKKGRVKLFNEELKCPKEVIDTGFCKLMEGVLEENSSLKEIKELASQVLSELKNKKVDDVICHSSDK